MWVAWKKEEIKTLREMAGKFTLAEISQRVNHSESAVRRKAYDLRLSLRLPVERNRAYKHPATLVSRVRELRDAGMPLKEIAAAVGLSRGVVCNYVYFDRRCRD